MGVHRRSSSPQRSVCSLSGLTGQMWWLAQGLTWRLSAHRAAWAASWFTCAWPWPPCWAAGLSHGGDWVSGVRALRQPAEAMLPPVVTPLKSHGVTHTVITSLPKLSGFTRTHLSAGEGPGQALRRTCGKEETVAGSVETTTPSTAVLQG